MRTVDSKGKKVACEFINAMCCGGDEKIDVSSADGQCECLLKAIIV